MNAPVENFAIPHFGEIPLTCVVPSKTNPRKRFDEADLADLAASIAKVGVAQPILCRPQPTSETSIDSVEIVAGERRYRASKLAGKETIPAIVRNLTDVEVLEIQLIENLQRADVHPIEEADGYERLMTEANYTADQLAEKVGKSRSYIYGRLKFCALAPAARESFFEGKLSASTALLIARIPTETLQEHAAAEIIAGHDGEPMSYREAAEHIHERYMLNLDRARFAIKDAKLVKDAGSCVACPKRTGNQAILYPDLSADICTDPNCFASKSRAHDDKVLATAQKKGTPVYEGDEAHEFLDETELVPAETRVFEFDRRVDMSFFNKKVEEVLKPELLPKPSAFVRVDGKVMAMYEETALQAALEKAGISKSKAALEASTQEERSPSDPAKAAKKEAQEQERQAALRRREQAAEAETTARVTAYRQIREAMKNGLTIEAWRAVAKELLIDHSAPQELLPEVYQWEKNSGNETIAYIDQASIEQLQLLIMDMMFGSTLSVNQYSINAEGHFDADDEAYQALVSLASCTGVDIDQVRKDLVPATDSSADELQQTATEEPTNPDKVGKKKTKVVSTDAWPFPTGARGG